MTTEETMTVTVTATATVNAIMTMAAMAAVMVEIVIVNATASATMKNEIMTAGVTVDAIAHRADVRGVGGGTRDPGHPGVVHVSFLQEIAVAERAQPFPLASRDRRWRSPTPPPRRGSPRRRSPDSRSTADARGNHSYSSRLSAPPEPKSPPQSSGTADVRRPQWDSSPSPASPHPPPSNDTRTSPVPASLTPLDKGKAKVTPQLSMGINEDVKMADIAPPNNPQPLDHPRKPSPQPPAGAPPASHSPHQGLPTNPKRLRTSQSQSNPQTSNASRSFRIPPIPPHKPEEVVKESLNKEASILLLHNSPLTQGCSRRSPDWLV
jgi:hypothetical protein